MAAIVQLASVRLVLESLGSEGYAIFALLTGLVSWFVLADFGVGSSTQNAVAERRGKSLPYEPLVVTALSAGLLLCLTLFLLFLFLSPTLGSLYLGRFGSLSESEQAEFLLLTALLSLAATAGSIIYKIWYGEQRGYFSNIFVALGSLLGLAAMWLVLQTDVKDKLLWSVIAFLGPAAAIPLGAAALRLMSSTHEILRLTGNDIRDLAPRAFRFWIFALMSAGVLNVDYIIMSQLLTAEDIVTYVIVTKVLGFAVTIYVAALMALWPVLTELGARGEWNAITIYIKKYAVAGALLVALSTALFAAFSAPIARVFGVHDAEMLPLSLILLAGAYYLVRVWTDTFAIVLQSLSDLRPFMYWVPVQALASATLQWVLAMHLGAHGLLLGLIVSFILTVAWVLPVRVKSLHLAHVRRAQ